MADVALLLADPPTRDKSLLEISARWTNRLSDRLDFAADRVRLFVLTWDPLDWLPGRSPSPWATATGNGDWAEVVAYIHCDALGPEPEAMLVDCAARLVTGAAAVELLVTSGAFADLAGRGAAPLLLAGTPADLGPALLEAPTGEWEPIGLGAIQDLVQEAYGPVDLDRARVALEPVAEMRVACPACQGERFGFPADLIDATAAMCGPHADAAERLTQERLRRANVSNPAGWRAMGKASALLSGAGDLPGIPLPSPRTPAIGRNDSCPCGSGRKFKSCCGAA